jgi:hypothetical protein
MGRAEDQSEVADHGVVELGDYQSLLTNNPTPTVDASPKRVKHVTT